MLAHQAALSRVMEERGKVTKNDTMMRRRATALTHVVATPQKKDILGIGTTEITTVESHAAITEVSSVVSNMVSNVENNVENTVEFAVEVIVESMVANNVASPEKSP